MKIRKLLFLGLLFFLPVKGSCLSLSDIRTEIRVRIKDSDATRRRYSDTQLNNIINQTQRDVINVTWLLKSSTDIALAIGTTYYVLPSQFLGVYRITLRNANLPETSLQELDSRFNGGNWISSTGLPDHYFLDPSMPAAIGVYPWPNNSSSTGTLHVIYFSTGTTLSSDTDVPFSRSAGDDHYAPFHDLLIYEPCYKIFLIEGDVNKAAEYKAYYEARIQLLMANVEKRPNFLPGFSGQRK